ncbi:MULTISPECIES: gamma-glutamyl-gamma-aminobutyrate hydrolase family protein [unclassified Leucobacter]|uniref:gamma-glutamyl-gamma-aminobutyrate hydrolase family protein n=1 Tax=unclassified Leucobacter TaxID=2621730 RepID=UPI00165DE60D|nr:MULTISPECIES: gamma-glutamyl-gamma-aminobutyrate hydrolase family protein [unclassified Leucobacter]MBC9937289.1 gamma-glutamyl-gamma-aminobutyrate hydrolase family protein [Leucobacter sp. cx-87]
MSPTSLAPADRDAAASARVSAQLAPVIGITVWRRSLPTYLGEQTDLFTLGSEYAARVAEAGGIPLLLAPVPESAVSALLSRVDGLLLSGGQDLCRATRGLPPGPEEAGDVDPERDAFERALLLAARAAGTPVLGICRGLQLTNVVLGGSLVEDIPRTSTHPLQDAPEAFLGDRHSVAFPQESRLAALYGTSERMVNSIHHQSIERLGSDLAVAAVAPDGIIEAAESTDPAWSFTGVQWHPEKLSGANELAEERALFAALIAAAQ